MNGMRKKGYGIRGMMATVLPLLLFMVHLLLFDGCGKEPGETDGAEGIPEGERYVAEFLSLGEYCESVSAVMLGSGQTVFFTGTKDNREMLFSMEAGKTEVKEYPLDLDAGMRVMAMGEDAEGNLLLAAIGYADGFSSDRKVERVVIGRMPPEGGELETVDTGDIFRGRKESSFYINHLYQDKDGNFYLSASQEVCVLHPDGSVYFSVSVGAYLSAMFVLRDGRIVVGYDGRRGWSLEVVDLSDMGLKPLGGSIAFRKGIYRGGVDTDLVYTQDGALYTCNLTDEKPTALLNWRDCNINSSHLSDCSILPDGRILALTVDFSAGAERELSILTRDGESGVEKKTLTYAALEVPFYVERDIVAFNKENREYHIEVKEYGDESMDYEDRLALLNADLVSGNAPDMVDAAFSGLSLERLAAAGVLENLTPYLERDDTIGREAFVESVIKAYERDGKLYAVMSSFGIQTLVGRASDVGDGSSWSMDEMMAWMESKGKDAEILESADKGTVLWLVCRMNKGLFMDEENGTCDFNGEEFRKILEFANRFPKEADGESGGSSQIDRMRNGRLLLVHGLITSVELYQVYEFEFGEPVNFIGYPAAGESGQILRPEGTMVAMHAASGNKEGVWEFMKFILSKKRQESLEATSGSGFPVLKSALEKLFLKEMEEEYYEDTDGEQKLRPKSFWGIGDLDVEVYAATEEQVGKIRAMIESARLEDVMEDVLFGMIYEEAEAYFDGRKDVEDVAEVLQNRMSHSDALPLTANAADAKTLKHSV